MGALESTVRFSHAVVRCSRCGRPARSLTFVTRSELGPVWWCGWCTGQGRCSALLDRLRDRIERVVARGFGF